VALPIEPVFKVSLSQSVAEAILKLVRNGDLRPGDRLPPERELIKMLNVGRSTVREALKSLALMNLLDIQQGRGAVVKDVSASMFFVRPDVLATLLDHSLSEELFEARQLIEVGAIPMVVERATDEDLAEIEDLLNQCRLGLERKQPVSDRSARFHSMLLGCVRNSVLQVFMESVEALLVERGEQLAKKPGFSQWELQSHTDVFEAVLGRDVARAQDAMREHLRVSAQALLSLLESAPLGG